MSVEQFYDIKVVAKTLSISERRVRALCQKAERGEPGGLKGLKIGVHWRVKESDLKEFIDQNSCHAGSVKKVRY
jgi:hypothetical protein